MATPREFELACPACDGPGIYAVEDGLRLRVGLTSNLSRFVRRQRTPVLILYVARLEPGEAPRAWKSLLSSLRAQGLAPRECQFEAGAALPVRAVRRLLMLPFGVSAVLPFGSSPIGGNRSVVGPVDTAVEAYAPSSAANMRSYAARARIPASLRSCGGVSVGPPVGKTTP